MKNGANAPGPAGVALAVIALIVGLFALATGDGVVGCVAVILAAVCAAAGRLAGIRPSSGPRC